MKKLNGQLSVADYETRLILLGDKDRSQYCYLIHLNRCNLVSLFPFEMKKISRFVATIVSGPPSCFTSYSEAGRIRIITHIFTVHHGRSTCEELNIPRTYNGKKNVLKQINTRGDCTQCIINHYSI